MVGKETSYDPENKKPLSELNVDFNDGCLTKQKNQVHDESTIPRHQEGSVASRVKMIESVSSENHRNSFIYIQQNIQYGSYLRLIDNVNKEADYNSLELIHVENKQTSCAVKIQDREGKHDEEFKPAKEETPGIKKKKPSVTFDENPVTIPDYDSE